MAGKLSCKGYSYAKRSDQTLFLRTPPRVQDKERVCLQNGRNLWSVKTGNGNPIEGLCPNLKSCGIFLLCIFAKLRIYRTTKLYEVIALMTETWKPIPMFCPNCGKMNYGYKGIDEKIKYECDRCMVKFVRVRKSRRHDTIEMFASPGQESVI